jgi:acyl transferase domain-containing protein
LSINSFGYGGTNASAILESANDYLRTHGRKQSPRKTFSLLAEPSVNGTNGTCNGHNDNTHGSPRWRILIISAFDKAGVKRQAKNLSMYIKDRLHHINDEFLDDLAYTLNTKRSIFNYKAVISASSASDLIEALEDENLAISKVSQKPRLGFVFTGQGAQYAGMGKGLLESFPVYAKTIRRCRDHLKTIGAPWDLLGILILLVVWQLLISPCR